RLYAAVPRLAGDHGYGGGGVRAGHVAAAEAGDVRDSPRRLRGRGGGGRGRGPDRAHAGGLRPGGAGRRAGAARPRGGGADAGRAGRAGAVGAGGAGGRGVTGPVIRPAGRDIPTRSVSEEEAPPSLTLRVGIRSSCGRVSLFLFLLLADGEL